MASKSVFYALCTVVCKISAEHNETRLSSKRVVCGRLTAMPTLPQPIKAGTRFIDPEIMKAELAWLADLERTRLPTVVVTHQLQVERRTGELRRPETGVLPLYHATNN